VEPGGLVEAASQLLDAFVERICLADGGPALHQLGMPLARRGEVGRQRSFDLSLILLPFALQRLAVTQHVDMLGAQRSPSRWPRG
jgi:hypothetical protein